MGSVWVAGSYQSDYARNYAREGTGQGQLDAMNIGGSLTAAVSFVVTRDG